MIEHKLSAILISCMFIAPIIIVVGGLFYYSYGYREYTGMVSSYFFSDRPFGDHTEVTFLLSATRTETLTFEGRLQLQLGCVYRIEYMNAPLRAYRVVLSVEKVS